MTTKPKRAAKRTRVKRLPKAKQLETDFRRQVDYEGLKDRVDLIEGAVRDHGKGIRILKQDHEPFASLDKRLKTIEAEKMTPTTTVVEQASGMSIAICFLIHDLVVGAMLGGGWLYWHTFGLGFPPGLK
jgi:hypothetical protein